VTLEHRADLTRCPTCGERTTSRTTDQPALIRHGGYGETTQTVVLSCTADDCDWWLETERGAVAP
jgi:hypothetical protein